MTKEEQEFHEWAKKQCLPLFYGSALLILVFLNAFHWIMPLISNGAYDSLQIRMLASLPSLILSILVFSMPALKKQILTFQTIQVCSSAVGIIWVTKVADFHPYYMTASLFGIIGIALAVVTARQVFQVFAICTIFTVLICFVDSDKNNVFQFLYYASFFAIACLLAIIKVRAHKKEYQLRRSLHRAIEEIKIERAKGFVREQLSFVGELAGNVALEVNVPLAESYTLLENFNQKIRKTYAMDDADEKLITRCFEQMARMKSLVSNAVYFSGKNFATEERQTAKSLIESAISFVQNMADQRQVQIELILDSKEVFLNGTNRDISQVLFHILKNAIEAAEKTKNSDGQTGNRWVQISSAFSSSDSVYIIEITDSGPGVTSDVQNKLFTPFVVGKDKKGHIGLGLSTSKSLLERFAGQIEFVSAEHRPTTVRMTIPAQFLADNEKTSH